MKSRRARRVAARVQYVTARTLLALPPRAQLRLAGGKPVEVDGQKLQPGGPAPAAPARAHRRARDVGRHAGAARRRARPTRSPTPGGTCRSGRRGPRDPRARRPAGRPPLRARRGRRPAPAARLLPRRRLRHRRPRHPRPAVPLLARDAGVHVLVGRLPPRARAPVPGRRRRRRSPRSRGRTRTPPSSAPTRRGSPSAATAPAATSAAVSPARARATAARARVPAADLPGHRHDRAQRRSHELFAEGFFLTRDEMDWFREHYLGRRADRADPRASPLARRRPRGLPPALVVTAGLRPAARRGRGLRRARCARPACRRRCAASTA